MCMFLDLYFMQVLYLKLKPLPSKLSCKYKWYERVEKDIVQQGRGKRLEFIGHHAPCSMPHAPCPMPHAPCSMPHASCSMPHAPCIPRMPHAASRMLSIVNPWYRLTT